MRPQPAAQERIIAGDRGLERLSAKLAATRIRQDLDQVLPLMCEELNADEATVSLYQGGDVIETLAETRKYDRTVWDLSRVPADREGAARPGGRAGDGRRPGDGGERGGAAARRSGYGSVLLVPIVHAGESVGVIEAYSVVERAWARTEINRARIICNQFASLIQTFASRRRPARSRLDGV